MTTTRRIRTRLALYPPARRPELRRSTSRAHPFDHVANTADGLHFLIGHIDVELVFQREDDVDAVHGVDAQLFEAAVDGDLRRVFALRFGDDPQDTLRQFVSLHQVRHTS